VLPVVESRCGIEQAAQDRARDETVVGLEDARGLPFNLFGWREAVRDDFGLPTGQLRARRETYPTRDSAEARRDELNAARHTTGTSALAEQRKAGELPFGYYARGWLAAQALKVAQGKLKQRTVDEYDRLLRTYILGELGGTAIAALTPAHCEALLTALVRNASRQGDQKPLTPGTAWDVLRRVLRYALHHGPIATNPTDRVDFSARRATGDHARFEHHPLSAKQVGRLASAVRGEVPGLPAYPAYALMVEFMAYTGLRASEVSGLEVGDLVLAPGPRCAVMVRRTKSRNNGEWVTGTLKSKKSRRTVPLPP
jgi:integrase